MADLCRVCNKIELHSASRKDYGICSDCVEILGLAPMPPPRRPPVPCVRCNGMRFVRAVPRVKVMELAGVTPRNSDSTVMVNKLTFPIATSAHVFGSGLDVLPPRFPDGIGTLESYACTSCGYVEWYCWDVDELPIGPEYMTDVVDFSPAKPYR